MENFYLIFCNSLENSNNEKLEKSSWNEWKLWKLYEKTNRRWGLLNKNQEKNPSGLSIEYFDSNYEIYEIKFVCRIQHFIVKIFWSWKIKNRKINSHKIKENRRKLWICWGDKNEETIELLFYIVVDIFDSKL